MDKVQTCPVCGKEGLPSEKEQCPQCNADLSCFRILDMLPERKYGWKGWGEKLVILTFLAIVGGVTGYQNIRIHWLLRENRKGLAQQMSQVNTLLERVESSFMRRVEPSVIAMKPQVHEEEQKEDSENTIKEAKSIDQDAGYTKEYASPSPEFFWYETIETDTLWDISERFYQQGRYYPVLIAMNPGINIFEIKGGERLRILKGMQDVIAIYNQSVQRTGSSKYLLYRLREEDSLKALSRRFYKREDQTHHILKANPNLRLEPGQMIRILLIEKGWGNG